MKLSCISRPHCRLNFELLHRHGGSPNNGMDDEFGPVLLETMIADAGFRGAWIFYEAQPVMKEAQRRTGRGQWGCIEKLAKLLLVKPPLSQDGVFQVLPEFNYVQGDRHA